MEEVATEFYGISPNNDTFWKIYPYGPWYELTSFQLNAHLVFGLLSSIYISKTGPAGSSNFKTSPVIQGRLLLSCAIFFLPLLKIVLHLLHIQQGNFVAVDSTCGLEALAWFIHILYLIRLRRSNLANVRNHKPVLMTWMLTFIGAVVQFITIVRQLKKKDHTLKSWEEAVIFSKIFLQLLYLVTLIPSKHDVKKCYETGQREIYPSINEESRSESETFLSGCPVKMSSESKSSDEFRLGVAGDGANLLSMLTLWWTNDLMKKGAEGGLNKADDVFQLPRKLKTDYIDYYFKTYYPKGLEIDSVGQNHHENPVGVNHIPKSVGVMQDDNSDFGNTSQKVSFVRHNTDVTLIRALFNAFGCKYFVLGIVKFIIDSLSFAGPLLLNALVSFMENHTEPISHGYYYALGLFSVTLITSFLAIHFNYQKNNIMLQVRGAVITTVYRKSLSVSLANLGAFTSGEIVNFMSVDSDRIVNFCNSFHALWSLPLQIAVALFLLHQQLGLAFLTGLGFALLLIPINKWLTVRIQSYNKEMMTKKDGRVKVMNEILHGIRIIKYYAWEKHFTDCVEHLRASELKSLRGIKYLDAMCVYFWATTPVLISILSFTTYASLGNELTAAKVFTSVALFNMLIGPLNAFPWVINGVIEAWVSVKRVQAYMDLEELDWTKYYSQRKHVQTLSPEMTHLEIKDGFFHWENKKQDKENASKEQRDEDIPSQSPEESDHLLNGDVQPQVEKSLETLRLEALNLRVYKGQLIGVIGAVGSGKSSLLAAITAEMTKEDGDISIASVTDGFGLVSQEAWIQHGTVKENIIFGKPFNFRRYTEIICSCALEDDLKILPAGDETEVGENGVTLSGGQKARLALARAMYQDKDIYLLDDPLAAVDAHVGAHLFSKCIMGLLGNKTRILCTHHTKYLKEADTIIVMRDGRIFDFGPPYMILSHSNILEDLEYNKDEDSQQQECEENQPLEDAKKDKGDGKLVEEEQKETGVVQMHVYYAYWKAVGNYLAPFVLVALFLMQVSRNINDWWLSYWVGHAHQTNSSHNTNFSYDHLGDFVTFSGAVFAPGATSVPERRVTDSASDNLRFYLGIYGGLAAANSIFTLLRAFSFAYGGLRAAKVVHSRILQSILKAPITFFDMTPIGRIINRFSSDIYTIDEGLPFILNIFLAQLYGTLGALAITCIGLPWFALFLVPVGVYYYFIQKYYRLTSRELKRIYSITMSPIYAHFSESLEGLTTIRAFREMERFKKENKQRLEDNQKARFSSYAVTAWLSFRLQMLGVAMVTAVALIAVLEHHLSSVDPGLVGLVLSYALSITSLLISLVTSFTETEKNMISMERAQQYVDGVPAETEDYIIQAPSSWPTEGHISFQDVCLSYRPHLPKALDRVTFKSRPGEKIGIVGRTGSGKSSLFLCMFRMVKYQEGVISIDGIDVSHLPLSELRSRLAIIPQDPFLFSGTIGENLDPTGKHQDADLWSVLEKCSLRNAVQKLGGLQADAGERGKHFSVGQRQLMCLARAMLTKAKVLCIDEATASVDMDTDEFLQKAIREEFPTSTVLTIAHRLNTIMDSDRVLVMNNGRVAEFGAPNDLLEDGSSMFYRLVNSTSK